jgi:hypothetical protein
LIRMTDLSGLGNNVFFHFCFMFDYFIIFGPDSFSK